MARDAIYLSLFDQRALFGILGWVGVGSACGECYDWR